MPSKTDAASHCSCERALPLISSSHDLQPALGLRNHTSVQSMSNELYIFDYYLFVSRRGDPPNPWAWELRRKSKPSERYFCAEGFRSAQAAEKAGKIILLEVREAAAEKRRLAVEQASLERRQKTVQRIEIAAAKKASRKPLSPERRSELARTAAYARAKALTPERRSEIGRKGGAASKGKPKVKKHR
jgi:general stress protein YciG